jgi:hypothetical protein
MCKDVEKRVKTEGQSPVAGRPSYGRRDACGHIDRKLQFATKNDEVRFRGRSWN